MHAQKLSISLPQQQCDFIETYRVVHHIKSRSDLIKTALGLLQQLELEACYREANQEITQAFDITTADGLDSDETWRDLF